MKEIQQKGLVIFGKFLLKNPEINLYITRKQTGCKKVSVEKAQIHNPHTHTNTDSAIVRADG